MGYARSAISATRSPAFSARSPLPRAEAIAGRLLRPTPLFVALAAIATAWLMHEGRRFTFIADEWTWLLHRRGTSPSVFLQPHAEHLAALPILAYKAFFQIFGTSSTVPFRLLAALLGALCSALLFVFVARRLGPWLALIPAAILLFFGPGWSDLLWTFQITYLGSLVAGFGALLAIDRDEARWDVVAAILLCAAFACSAVGLMILAGAAVELALRARVDRARLRRLWVVAAPLALYLIWYSAYGVGSLQPSRIHTIPLYTFDGLSATTGSIVGLASFDGGPLSVALDPGTTITVLLLALLGARLIAGRPLPPRFWGMIVTILAFWSADTLAFGVGRSPEASRYTYPMAMFVLIAAAEFGFGWRPTRRAVLVLGIGGLAAITSNLGLLRQGANDFSTDSIYAKAELGAMTVARDVVSPSFSPAEPAIASLLTDHGMSPITAGPYFSAVDKFGSPADSVPEILRQSEPVRQAADFVLAKAERLQLQPQPRATARCTATKPSLGIVEVVRGPGRLRVHVGAAGASAVLLRRFATTFKYVSLGPIPPRRAATLWLPTDGSNVPWHVRVLSRSPVAICGGS